MSVPDSKLVIDADVDKPFKLTRDITTYWDYEYPAKETWRGESKRVRAAYKAGDKFQLKEVVKTTRNYKLSRTRTVDYQVLLVAFETEPWEYEPEPYHYIWNIYEDKVYITPDDTLPPPIEEPVPAMPLSVEEIEEIILQHKYPTLRKDDTGINVVTLQIWLKMLGYYADPTNGQLDEATAQSVESFRAGKTSLPTPADPVVVDWNTWEAMENILKQGLPPKPDTLKRLPFPRRRDYDTEEEYQKALCEGLKRFGFPIRSTKQFRLRTNEDGIGRLTNLPPGEYDLTIESLNKEPARSAEINLVDEYGNPMTGTVVLNGLGRQFSAKVDTTGTVFFDGLPEGEYEFSIQNVESNLEEVTGSVEVRLVDEADQPVSAYLVLSGGFGEPNEIRRAVKLFRALVHGFDSFETEQGADKFPHFITDELEETKFNARAWDNFRNTWGRFYGAPWMGILFDPLNDSQWSGDNQASNWGTYQTVELLHRWGMADLRASANAQEIIARLQKPIAIRNLSRAIGGYSGEGSGSSQAGRSASAHLPRLSSWMVSNIPSGQYYGDVECASPEYSARALERQLLAFATLPLEFRARCVDAELVDRLQTSVADRIITDKFAENNVSNSVTEIEPAKGGKRNEYLRSK